jgi:predicted ATPase
LAAQKWNRQIIVSTHSPVLVSQFEPDDILSVEMDPQRRTILRKITSIPEIRDLLEHYAVGALYMAEEVARQSSTNELAPAGSP